MNDIQSSATLSKASICSVITMEVIDFAKKTDADQAEVKKNLHTLIESAIIDIAPQDRIVLAQDHGAVIVCNGPLEDALEDALMISLTVRDEILKNNAQSLKPWYVQFGINLGNVKLTTKKGQQVVVGEGVDEAERIMSFANPNQILVSRVYYEMASKVTQEISNMFEQYDMHAHDQEIYAVQLKGAQAMPLAGVEEAQEGRFFNKLNWKYAAAGLVAVVVIAGLGKQAFAPSVPRITMDESLPEVIDQAQMKTEAKAEAKPELKPMTEEEISATNAVSAPTEPTAQTDTPVVTPVTESALDAPAKKSVKSTKKAKPEVEAQIATSASEKPKTDAHANATEKSTEAKHAESKHVETKNVEEKRAEVKTADAKASEPKADKTASKSTSSWESFRKSIASGTEHPCSQAESAMGQCTR